MYISLNDSSIIDKLLDGYAQTLDVDLDNLDHILIDIPLGSTKSYKFKFIKSRIIDYLLDCNDKESAKIILFDLDKIVRKIIKEKC